MTFPMMTVRTDNFTAAYAQVHEAAVVLEALSGKTLTPAEISLAIGVARSYSRGALDQLGAMVSERRVITITRADRTKSVIELGVPGP